MSIYKDCDIRGVYKQEFDEQAAYAIGRALGSMSSGARLAVAGDVRRSTPSLKLRLIEGLLESGADVTDLGLCPTPAFYFALANRKFAGGVTVTASHNPPEYNGFKFMLGKEPVSPAMIKEVERRVRESDFGGDVPGGKLEYMDILPAYEASLTEYFPKGRLKIVLDCGNGCMSEAAPRVVEALGHDVVRLYCEYDGRFPNRNPNPAVYEHLDALRSAVLREKADFGAAFDGDGDRVVFVDDLSRVVTSEMALVMLIKEHLASKDAVTNCRGELCSPAEYQEPSANGGRTKFAPTGIQQKQRCSVVYDLKSSSIVKNAVLEMGGAPLMERSGHAFIKKRFLDNASELAGEISGHFFFKRLGYDDGLYAALEMASIVMKNGRLSALADAIPQTVISPDLRAFCPYSERDALLDRVREMGKDFEVNELDGVRVDFGFGWLLVRKSVTEEGVTARMEARDEAAMEEIKRRLVEAAPVFGDIAFFL